jgi:nucleotide-binding universal stress UspA family protein
MNTHASFASGHVRRISALAGVVIAGAAFVIATPVTVDNSGVHLATVLAGKGNDKDNGNGRDGRSGGNAHGHSKANRGGDSLDGMDGKKPKLPGSLNASHASPRALANANRNSPVGALGAYMDAMADYVDALERGDLAAQQEALDAAAAALADAANKDIGIDTGVVDAVNRALNGKSEGFDHTGEPGDPIHEAESEVANRINPPPMQ